jgi:hypothetical protein
MQEMNVENMGYKMTSKTPFHSERKFNHPNQMKLATKIAAEKVRMRLVVHPYQPSSQNQ